MHFRADKTTIDAGKVKLEGGVVVTYDRYRLTSDAVVVERDGDKIDISGASRIALCPCESPPVSLGLSGASFVGGELYLRSPTLYVGSVQVFGVPWLWIRPPDRPALLPPTIALRGGDGLLLGLAGRVPWRGSDGALRSVELRAAGYVKGGVEIGARLKSPSFSGSFVWDHLQQDRFVADTHGFVKAGSGVALRVDLDLLRGQRGLRATPSLELAARPFDVGIIEVSTGWKPSPSSAARLGTGIALRGRRGEGEMVWGPTASASANGSAGSRGSWETNLSLAMLSGASSSGATPLGRAEAHIDISPRFGPFELGSSVRSRARIAAPSDDPSPSFDALAEARAELRLPLVRAFASAPDKPPIVHRISPLLELGAAVSRGSGGFFLPNRPHLGPLLGLAGFGARSSLRGSSGTSFDAEARVGLLGSAAGTNSLAWLRLEGSTDLAAALIEASATDRVAGASPDLAPGIDALSELRIGRARGPSVLLDVYGRTGGVGALARSFGATSYFLGDSITLLADRGLAFGAGFSSPLSGSFDVKGRVDVDARAPALLGANGAIGYRHPSGCLALELGGSFRVARRGVDVWLLVDLVPPLSR